MMNPLSKRLLKSQNTTLKSYVHLSKFNFFWIYLSFIIIGKVKKNRIENPRKIKFKKDFYSVE
jgi:hypothetical protein